MLLKVCFFIRSGTEQVPDRVLFNFLFSALFILKVYDIAGIVLFSQVQSGWRIEYCAASENETYCPEEFEEFYKQRRRWIASTLANIISLIKEWSLIRTLNHRVSYLFCIYQIFLLTSTFIGPSTVIIIVAGKYCNITIPHYIFNYVVFSFVSIIIQLIWNYVFLSLS